MGTLLEAVSRFGPRRVIDLPPSSALPRKDKIIYIRDMRRVVGFMTGVDG
jgi:hypothetical protein